MVKYTVTVTMNVVVDTTTPQNAAHEVRQWLDTGIPSNKLTGCQIGIGEITEEFQPHVTTIPMYKVKL